MGSLAKGLSIQLQKLIQLDAENVWEIVCWEIKGYTKFVALIHCVMIKIIRHLTYHVTGSEKISLITHIGRFDFYHEHYGT